MSDCGSLVRLATADDLRAVGIDVTGRTRRPVSGVWEDWHLPSPDALAALDPAPRVAPPPLPAPPDDGGYTLREVADLAGVSVTAVSNWRRRVPTFPAPTAGVRNGRTVWLFDPDEIHRWLTERETNR